MCTHPALMLYLIKVKCLRLVLVNMSLLFVRDINCALFLGEPHVSFGMGFSKRCYIYLCNIQICNFCSMFFFHYLMMLIIVVNCNRWLQCFNLFEMGECHIAVWALQLLRLRIFLLLICFESSYMELWIGEVSDAKYIGHGLLPYQRIDL